jgi:hypothetical protein
MRQSARVIGFALAAVSLTACATRQTARLEAANTLANAPVLARTTNAPTVVGVTEMAYGDRFTAANLFERAADARATAGARFKLASAYEATGRTAEAAALYRGLVNDGQFTWMYSARSLQNRDAPVRRFNVADESARRLADLERVETAAQVNPQNGLLAANELGVPAAAVVGEGPRGRIPDAEAMTLDARDNP